MNEVLRPLLARDIAQNGYITLPGGLIIQWGNTPSLASGASATVAYNIPFPNGFFQVTATGGSNGNAATASGYTVESAASKVNFTLRNWGGNALAAGSWIAIGY